MAAGSLIYVGKSRLRRLKKEKRQQRKLEKEIKKEKKRKARLTAVTLPTFVPEVRYSPLEEKDNDNDNDSGIDQEEEAFLDDSSLGSFGEDFIPLDWNIELLPKTAKLGFNYVDFQKFSKMPFFKKKEEVKVEVAVEKVTEAVEEKVETKSEEKSEEKVETVTEVGVEKKEEETKEGIKPDANGEVKADGAATAIKDIGGGKLGKGEGGPVVQSEAPQPILCCTIL